MNNTSDKQEKSTKKISNQEIFIQIYLPLIFVILVFLFLCVMLVLGATNGTSPVHHWANISFLFVSIPTIIFSLIVILVLALLIYGQAKLIRWLPIQIKKIYLIVLKISLWIWNFTQKITQPPIKIKSSIYGIKHGLHFKKDIKD